MSQKHVLDVGNCAADHATLSTMVEQEFDAQVVQVHSAAEALDALGRDPFDLVLVNRILDRDGSEGIDIIRSIKGDSKLAHVPAMLITNFADHQQAAIGAGAEPGFGKRDIASPQTRDKLARFLK